MAEIIPAIIPKHFQYLSDEVALVKDFVPMVQVDITDGVFVKNKTWPYYGDHGEFEQLLQEDIGLPFWEDVDYEFHLMVEHPETVVGDWIKAGASSLIVHVEAVAGMAEMEQMRTLCQAGEVTLGLAIKPGTDVSVLEQYIEQVDFLQCMGSDELGHHGVTLNPEVLERISTLHALYSTLPIAIDIGVTPKTAESLLDAGATRLVAGGAIFESVNIPDTINFFQSL